MSTSAIICKPTKDTFMRFGVVLLALWGFALYFFYDASIGYPLKNAVYFSHKAFADNGDISIKTSNEQWQQLHAGQPLIKAEKGKLGYSISDSAGKQYQLPAQLEACINCPPQYLNHELMTSGWGNAWADYSAQMHYPIKPSDKPYDAASIQEQWIAGSIATLLGSILLYFIIRTARRVISINGKQVIAAGKSFQVSDISCIDLRQWGAGYKGSASLVVQGDRKSVV